MGKRLKLTFKKHTQIECLVWLVIILPFFFAFLVELLGLPRLLRYSLDIAWVMMFIYILLKQQKKRKIMANALACLVLAFFVYTAICYVVNFQSALYYLWGIRNNFRFFVAFFAFSMSLKAESISYYFKAFDVFFWINVAISLVQFFSFGLEGDHLGGVFGAEKGANAYTVVFFVVVLTKSVLYYLEKKESLLALLLKSAAALLVAVLAELKFFFLIFMMIFVLAILFTKFTWRKVWVILGGVVAVMAFAALLVALFPMSENFLSLEFILEYAASDKGYTSSGDLNRLNAMSIINEEWLQDGWQRLFGLGLGNCDYSGFEFLVTPFYESYGDMHYTWISYAFLYLETGWIGLAFYYCFFILVFWKTLKIEKRSEGSLKIYCRIGRVLAICCMVIAIYNASLRTEAGYMMFFALAVPFALDRENRKRAYLYDKKMDTKNPV